MQVVETHSDVSKWAGFAVWDSDNQRVAQLAGKFGQQTRLILTTDYKQKVRRSNHISSTSPLGTDHTSLKSIISPNHSLLLNSSASPIVIDYTFLRGIIYFKVQSASEKQCITV